MGYHLVGNLHILKPSRSQESPGNACWRTRSQRCPSSSSTRRASSARAACAISWWKTSRSVIKCRFWCLEMPSHTDMTYNGNFIAIMIFMIMITWFVNDIDITNNDRTMIIYDEIILISIDMRMQHPRLNVQLLSRWALMSVSKSLLRPIRTCP